MLSVCQVGQHEIFPLTLQNFTKSFSRLWAPLMPLSLALKRDFTAEKTINLYGSPPRTRSRAYAPRSPRRRFSYDLLAFLAYRLFRHVEKSQEEPIDGETLRSSYKPLSWFNYSIPAKYDYPLSLRRVTGLSEAPRSPLAVWGYPFCL